MYGKELVCHHKEERSTNSLPFQSHLHLLQIIYIWIMKTNAKAHSKSAIIYMLGNIPFFIVEKPKVWMKWKVLLIGLSFFLIPHKRVCVCVDWRTKTHRSRWDIGWSKVEIYTYKPKVEKGDFCFFYHYHHHHSTLTFSFIIMHILPIFMCIYDYNFLHQSKWLHYQIGSIPQILAYKNLIHFIINFSNELNISAT